MKPGIAYVFLADLVPEWTQLNQYTIGLTAFVVVMAAILYRALAQKSATENAAALVLSRSEQALGLSTLPFSSSQVGGYTLQDKLSEGVGFITFRARDKAGALCDVKIPTTASLENRTLMARFEREARVLEGIDSPNVVKFRAYEKIRDRGRVVPVLVTEALDGEELTDLLRREAPLSVLRAVSVMKALAGALAAVHRNEVVHRNVKPSSIRVLADGRVVLSNFGVAQADDEQQVTQRGDVLGTGLYMAPEAIMGKSLDNRADIYSLGVVGFEMLTGRPPHAGASFAELVMKKMSDEVPSVAQGCPTIPRELEQLVTSLLAKEAKQRPPSAGNLMSSLSALEHELESASAD